MPVLLSGKKVREWSDLLDDVDRLLALKEVSTDLTLRGVSMDFAFEKLRTNVGVKEVMTNVARLVVFVRCPARRLRCLYPEGDGGGGSGGGRSRVGRSKKGRE